MEQDQAFQLVCEAIDVVNRQLPPSRRLHKDPQTVIVGGGGSLDSLGLINFVITLEEKASDAIGSPIQLLDESAIIDEQGPFRTVASLASFLATLPRG
jgi:hypothetical protein